MIPTGKGVFIWNIAASLGGDPARIARELKTMGCSWAAVKMADGTLDKNLPLLGPTAEALRLAGIAVWGWHYIYGANRLGVPFVKSETARAVQVIGTFRPAGWLVDAEQEYKRSGGAGWANTYMTGVRSAFPSLSLGLCSYRFPSLHPEFPWRDFLRYADFHAPQVYWIKSHNPAAQLKQSCREVAALRDLPIVPVGAAFQEQGWKPSVAEIDEFDRTAHELKLPGVGWWCLDDEGIEKHPEYREAITRHAWGLPPPPPALTLDERVAILEREARARQWNLSR